MKQEKNDKVSLNISQTAIVLIIAMVFTGVSIQIARFHSHSRRGAYARVKNTCAGTLVENGRGRIREGGGRNSGILRYCVYHYALWEIGDILSYRVLYLQYSDSNQKL